MNIEYIKIKSFGNVDNLKLESGDVSAMVGKGELGLAAYAAFQLFLFYGSEECGTEVLPYLQSAKGPVAGGYAMLSDGTRRYIVAREYLNGEERLLIKDADTDVEITVQTSAGMFFFSRNAAEFMYGSEGAPVDIGDLLKTATIKLDSTSKINANEILMLRERLDALGKKQMRLGAESMAVRGINTSERLQRARAVQKELLENEEELKNDSSDEKPVVMKKKVFFSLLGVSGALFLLGFLLLMFMQYISVEKTVMFFISLSLIGVGGMALVWLGLFKLIEKLVMKNVTNLRDTLTQRRAELTEKLDILLEGSDFEELERMAESNTLVKALARSAAEIERELEVVRREMDEVRAKLNAKLSE